MKNLKLNLVMMLAMVAHLTFASNDRREEFEIRRISKCKIDSSWENLTDKAEIELPRNIKLPLLTDGSRSDIKSWIRRGDLVTVELGYNNQFYHEFTGFVTEVQADLPVKITCEDWMWKLKQTTAAYSSKNTTVKELLEAILPIEYALKIDAVDSTIGAFRTKPGETVTQVLQRLKDIGLYSYFKGDTLVCGRIYLDDPETVNYDFSQNIISNSLKYLVADDSKLKITATSTLNNGEKIQVTVGDEEGQEQRLSYFNITDKEKLKEMAQEDLNRLKVDGYEGSFTTFGIPFVAHGFKCKLTDKDYPERAGTYRVAQVTTTFSDGGFRRDVKLDRQA